ncbi:hypothetical protein D9757_007300 [Collybiopsis confluens]|uniref:Uncharacterized protein n=1 Tax=Collybiopsis confluens TaxID=2823264 RepID=A0A8H5HGK7_9AGAR|nr:hypothetical protein D9757_007300 [Collybiopsis confluens]
MPDASDSTSSPNPALTTTDMAQIMAQMAQIMAAAQIIAQSSPLAVTIPPPPPFVSSNTASAPLGLFLHYFPMWRRSTSWRLLDMSADGLRNLDIMAAAATEGDLDTLDKSQGPLKDYPTFDSLLVPMTTYFSILISYASLGGMPEIGCALATLILFL